MISFSPVVGIGTPPHPLHTLACGREGFLVYSGDSDISGKLTIYVPVVFMVQYVMVLRGATSLRGALEGLGPENRNFFGP